MEAGDWGEDGRTAWRLSRGRARGFQEARGVAASRASNGDRVSPVATAHYGHENTIWCSGIEAVQTPLTSEAEKAAAQKAEPPQGACIKGREGLQCVFSLRESGWGEQTQGQGAWRNREAPGGRGLGNCRAEGGVGAGGCDFCLAVLPGGMDLGMCLQGDRGYST